MVHYLAGLRAQSANITLHSGGGCSNPHPHELSHDVATPLFRTSLLQVMDAVLLHVLNHCAKTADVIKKNNDKIKGADAGECLSGR